MLSKRGKKEENKRQVMIKEEKGRKAVERRRKIRKQKHMSEKTHVMKNMREELTFEGKKKKGKIKSIFEK